MHNLLVNPIVTARSTDAQEVLLSLPEVFEKLARDEVADFPYIRPHQAPAWHVLLVQLATFAQLKNDHAPLRSADEWRNALRTLTPAFSNDEPWRLSVDDWTLPAFLQPPCIDASDREHYTHEYLSADSLDVLITAKNHDQKVDRMRTATPEEWLYALVTLQTTGGYFGKGNYGIARMNGGSASRPIMRCATASLGIGGCVFRDVRALVDQIDNLTRLARELDIGTQQPVHELLWLMPWNGSESLELKHVHPLAVEVCRRVRISTTGEQLVAHSAGTEVARIAAKEAKGVVADPWIPVDREKNKAFTVTAEGFSYRRMVALLDARQYARPLLAQPTPDEKRSNESLVIHAAALARGEGKTEGFHCRRVFLKPNAAALFATNEPSFVERAARYVDLAGSVTGKALRPALIQLVQGNEDPDRKKPSKGQPVEPWIKYFDAKVDQVFFSHLSRSFEEPALDEDAAERTWSQTLESLALFVFKEAAEATPRQDQRLILAHARALSLLRNSLRKYLPALRAHSEEVIYDA
jgi:CRISPR system Cascade subunit CasA